jgi:hemerythrin
MAFLPWQEKYQIGHPVIDEQHRIIFDQINELHDGVQAGRGQALLGRTIQGLVSYASMHFAMEEQLMKAGQYPGIDGHLQAHADFVKHVLTLQSDMMRQGETTAMLLSEYLKAWLVDHILKEDQRLARFLTQR